MSNQKTAQKTLLISTDLHKTYRTGGEDLHILQGVDLKVKQGEWLAILGASGSGKSTLLHLLGGLDRPSNGHVQYNNQDIYKLSRKAINQYRNRDVGFVFQFYHLLPELTALENVTIAGMISGSTLSASDRKKRAEMLLDQLGMSHRLKHRPNKLSGGERQRVAIARALLNEPDLLLADEPTGNLDADTGQQILDLFIGLHQQGQTIVMVTHDQKVADLADRQLVLDRGLLKQ
jgi:ABC-type lipoprotein export system ATPase subunit